MTQSIEETLQEGGRLSLCSFKGGLSLQPLVVVSIEGDRKSIILGRNLGYGSLLSSLQLAFDDYKTRDHATMHYIANPLPKNWQPVDSVLLKEGGRLTGIYSRLRKGYLFTAETSDVFQAQGDTIIEAWKNLNQKLEPGFIKPHPGARAYL